MLLSHTAILSLAIALVSAIAPADNAALADSKFVSQLSQKNFGEFVKDESVKLVEFYAPWCGHCKQLAPNFVKAAEELQKDGVKLAQMDCTQNQEICEKEGIRGYPTLRVYKNGNFSEYEGTRNPEGIIKYMRKQIEPAVTELTGDKLADFSKKDDVVVVGFFKPGSPEEAEFAKVAEKLHKDYSFGSIKAPSVVMFKKFDEKYAVFEGAKFDEKALEEFVAAESVPLMAEIGPENYMKYFESKTPLLYFFYGDEEQKSKYGGEIESAIKEYKGKLNAVYIKAAQFGQHADALNLPKEWPGIVIHDLEKDKKYPFATKETINKENIAKYVKGVLSGETKPTYKSQPIPEKEETAVKTLVHDNFDKLVFESKKDVLVEFYAPWCGACKALAPVYEALAKKYAAVKGGDKIVVAKFDAVNNDMPDSVNFELRAYPTLKLFKAGSKEPVDFDGERTLKGFVDFLNANTKLTNVSLTQAELDDEEEAKKEREKAQKAREEAAAAAKEKAAKAASEKAKSKEEL